MQSTENVDTAVDLPQTWNKGRLLGPKPPLQPKHVWAIRTRLQLAKRTRDLALFNLAIDSKLRGCDVVSRMGISSSQMHKERYLKRAHEVAEDVARTFVRELNKGELSSPKFRHLMNFRAMQNMSANQKGSINEKYWQERGWFDAEYYTKVSINPFARMLAGYIARKMRGSTRKGNQQPYR